jgi:hypothetical protein
MTAGKYIVCFTAFLQSAACGFSQDSSWHSVPVNCPYNEYRGCYLGIAAEGGSIHLLYCIRNTVLCYSFSDNNGKDWKTEVIEDSTDYPQAKFHYPFEVTVTDPQTHKQTKGHVETRYAEFAEMRASIVLDSKGEPHIAYLVGYHNTTRSSWIRYGYRHNGKWTLETVDSRVGDSTTTSIMGEVAMRLDSKDRPHLVYSIYNENTRYAWHSASSWKITELPNTIYNWPGLGIVMDKKDQPHIAIGHLQTSGEITNSGVVPGLSYAWSGDEGKTWRMEEITHDNWFECDIALDTNDVPYISYRSIKSGLYVAHRTGKGDWDISDVTRLVSTRAVIAFDACNVCHLVTFRDYSWPGNTSLLHLYGNGNDWKQEVITDEALNGCSAGMPGFCITDSTLYVTTQSPGLTQRVLFRHLPGSCASKKKKTAHELQPDSLLALSPDTVPRLLGRTLVAQGTVEVTTRLITISVWDDKTVDNDVISLWMNGRWLLQNYSLDEKKKVISLQVEEGAENSLMLYAINQGYVPPCTTAITIRSGGREQTLELKSDLKTCGILNIKYTGK